MHPDSDAEDGVNVDVDVKAPRGNFFVRLTLQVCMNVSGNLTLLDTSAQHDNSVTDVACKDRLQGVRCMA